MRRAAAFRRRCSSCASLHTGLLVALAIGLTLTSAAASAHPQCTSWPRDYREALGPPATPASAATRRVPHTHVLLDRSGSMVGYVNETPPPGAQTPAAGKWVGPNPYANLLKALPGLLRDVTDQADLRYFGKKVHDPEPLEHIVSATQKMFYTCARNAGSCDNQESHIRDALERAYAAPPEDLSLVITDLFLDEHDAGPEGAAAIRVPLEKILGDGRVVGILGMLVPFNGYVTDLPVDATASPKGFPFSGRHPVYLLIIGQNADVRHFRAVLQEEYLQEINENGYESHFLIFGDAALGAPRSLTPEVAVVPGRRAKAPGNAFFHVAEMDALPVTGRPELRRLNKDLKLTLPHLDAEVTKSLPPDSVVSAGSLSVTTQIWPLPTNASCWGDAPGQQGTAVREHFEASAAVGRVVEALSPGLQAALPVNRAYLVLTTVDTQLTVDEAASAWLRRWSFNALTVDAQLHRPDGNFGTLNLDAILRPLKDLVSAKLGPPRRVAHSEAIVYLEN